MDDDRKIDVDEWQDSPHPLVLGSRKIGPKRFWSPTALGVIGTLLLHGAFLPSAYFGSCAHRTLLPKIQEPGDAVAAAKSAASGNLELVHVPMAIANRTPIVDFASLPALNKVTLKMPIDPEPPTFLDIETLALDEEKPADSTNNSAEGAERARLVGIYSRQMQARIDRVWRRPRSAVNEDGDVISAGKSQESFQCRVQIVQDPKGYVQEVLLLLCNGSAAWQRSLVTAVLQASPLPAPPSPSVFSRSVTLDFVGLAYGPDAQAEGYEIVRHLPGVVLNDAQK